MAVESLGGLNSQSDHLSALISVTWQCLLQYGAPAGACSGFAYLLTFWLGSFQQRATYIGAIGLIFVLRPSPPAQAIIGWTLFVLTIGALLFALKRTIELIVEYDGKDRPFR